jgi:putative membrane protein
MGEHDAAGSDGDSQMPDPRFSLANERTFLAWVRTALAMLAGAVALDSLGVPHEGWLRRTLVVALVLFGGSVTAAAFLRWSRVDRAIRTGTPLPHFALGLVVTVAIVAMSLLLAVVLALA